MNLIVGFQILLSLLLPAILFGQTNAVDFYCRGLSRQTNNDTPGAIADFTRAIELNPKYIEAIKDRGNAKASKGDLAGALADYNLALEIDPRYARAYNNRGLIQQY